MRPDKNTVSVLFQVSFQEERLLPLCCCYWLSSLDSIVGGHLEKSVSWLRFVRNHIALSVLFSSLSANPLRLNEIIKIASKCLSWLCESLSYFFLPLAWFLRQKYQRNQQIRCRQKSDRIVFKLSGFEYCFTWEEVRTVAWIFSLRAFPQRWNNSRNVVRCSQPRMNLSFFQVNQLHVSFQVSFDRFFRCNTRVSPVCYNFRFCRCWIYCFFYMISLQSSSASSTRELG